VATYGSATKSAGLIGFCPSLKLPWRGYRQEFKLPTVANIFDMMQSSVLRYYGLTAACAPPISSQSVEIWAYRDPDPETAISEAELYSRTMVVTTSVEISLQAPGSVRYVSRSLSYWICATEALLWADCFV
jgi:hypothetical protein